MNTSICTCRLISLGDDMYEWCRLCGRLIYRYEDCSELPFSSIINVTGSIICEKSDFITLKTRIIEPSNVRVLIGHKHDFFVLSATDAWCKTCGTLRIRRPLGQGLNIEIKEGFISPQRRQSSIQVRREAKLPVTFMER
jgi:hypothetical protein